MNRTTVLGAFVLAWSWLFAYPVYDSPDGWVAAGLAVLGSAVVLFGSRASIGSARSHRWPAALHGLAFVLLPSPFDLPFAALALAALGAGRWRSGLRTVGLIAALQAATLVLLLLPSQRGTEELSALHVPIAGLLRLAGIAAITDTGGLWLDLGSRWTALRITLDSTGLTTAALMLVPLLLLHRGRLAPLVKLAIALVVFAAVRFVAVVVWCRFVGGGASALCDPVVLAASFAVFAAVVGRSFEGTEAPAVRARPRLAPGVGVLGAALGAAFLLPFSRPDSGSPTPGRMLVDDAHGPWEPGGSPATLDDFGVDSVYNYGAMWDWVGRSYPIDILREGELTSERLRDVDILVLKMPSFAYGDAERAAIEAFVRRGGGLFAIGDHTDVFGTTSCLNPVLQPFGVEIEKNVGGLLLPRGVGGYRYRKDELLGNPITRYVGAGIDMMGPATIRVTEGRADHFMAGAPHALDPVDYRDGSFFGDTDATIDDVIGPFIFCVAKRVDAGRVVVWSDSTVFSNFAMFEPGKPEVLRGILEYLNRAGSDHPVFTDRLATAGPAILLIVVALLSLLPAALLPLLLSGIAIGLGLVGWWTRAAVERLPQRPLQTPYTEIGFDAVLGQVGIDFPRAGEQHIEQPGRSPEYSAAYCSVLRQRDRFPRVVQRPSDLDDVDVLVVVDPRRPVDTAWRDRVFERVAAGMQLLLIESFQGGSSSAAELLSPVGLGLSSDWDRDVPMHTRDVAPRSFAGTEATVLSITDAAFSLAGWERSRAPGDELVVRGAPILSVVGGSPVWTVGVQASPILSVSPYGSGRVFLFAGGATLRNAELGIVSHDLKPADPQWTAHRLWARLLDTVAGDGRGPVQSPGATPDGDEHPAGSEPEAAIAAEPPSPAADLFSRLAERSRAPGARRAPVICIVRRYERAAFVAGFAAADRRSSVVRIAGATGALAPPDRLQIDEFRSAGEALLWAQHGHHDVLAIERLEGTAPGDPFSPPGHWAERSWTVEPATLAQLIDPRDDAKTQGLWQLARTVLDRADNAGFMSPGWVPVEGEDACLLLRSEEELPLAAGWLGRVEMLVQLEPLSLRKLVLSMRHRGEVGETAWISAMILFGPLESHDDDLGLPDVPPERVVPATGLRLQRLRGR